LLNNNGKAMNQEIKPTHITFEQYESYCDLKLLQLLYDKGFRFKLETEGHRVINNLAEQRFNEGDVSYCNNYITYSVVVEWLRVNHGIWVRVEPDWDGMWWAQIKSNSIPHARIGKWQVITACAPYNSPQEAYSAAFDYVLNNLL
jgi:hypothetical protein